MGNKGSRGDWHEKFVKAWGWGIIMENIAAYVQTVLHYDWTDDIKTSF